MQDTCKQRISIIKACFAATIISTGILVTGCDSGWNPVSDKSWTVGDCEIHEKTEVSEVTWPDAVYKRTYWLIRDGTKRSVGSYENESSAGVIKDPYAIGQCIVIPTSAYVFLIESDNQIKKFNPYQADQWLDFAEPRGINGHYDYHLDTVQEIDGSWRLPYALESGLNGGRPQMTHFVTKDNWQSFQIENDKQEHEEEL